MGLEGPIARVPTDGAHPITYFHADGQGSTRALTNEWGAVVQTTDYDAFGTVRAENGSAVNDFKYTGQSQGREGGLVHLGARYYDPKLGRFISRDPLAGFAGVPQSLNRYSYTRNNPVNRADPTGLTDIDSVAALAASMFSAGGATGQVGSISSAMGSLDSGLTWTFCTPGSALCRVAFDIIVNLMSDAVDIVAFEIDPDPIIDQLISKYPPSSLGATHGSLTPDDLMQRSRKISESRDLIQYEHPGGLDEANRLFDELAGSNPVRTYNTPRGVVRSVALPGGGTASIRPFSSKDNHPTIQFDKIGPKQIKIRFPR
jgi:RHS repeat-associated protein